MLTNTCDFQQLNVWMPDKMFVTLTFADSRDKPYSRNVFILWLSVLRTAELQLHSEKIL